MFREACFNGKVQLSCFNLHTFKCSYSFVSSSVQMSVDL